MKFENKILAQYPIEIRRATKEDRSSIIEISKTVWEGEDYLPQVFDKWLEEEQGEFSVITWEGIPVGCAKITVLSDETLWLEGMRIRADYRGKGLAGTLAKYQLERAQSIGYKKIEMGTFIENKHSIRIIESNDFEKVAGFKLFTKKKTEFANKKIEMVPKAVTSKKETLSICKNVLQSHPEGYISLDWTFHILDEKLLEALIEKGCLYKIEDTFFAFGRWKQKDDGLTIYFIEKGTQTQQILSFIEENARNMKAKEISFAAPKHLEEDLLLAGYFPETNHKEDVFVYRKTNEKE